ncbi:MAG: SusC/RagA family TonB-linked outer membrane protein [Bacteroidales bacterium]|nr:SusC/RagA family TonB-linked outer membrane protein [Candidatus Cryptobacteroides aphodequi]
MKKLFALLALSALTLCLAAGAAAQTRKITGTVTGSDSEVLVSATALSASGKYAIADIDGKFSLDVKEGESVTVSFFGYDDVTFTVGAQSNYDIILPVSEANVLDATVVIGYGTTTKKEITGSVSSLRSDDFDKGAFNDAAGMLQGKVAGLSITNPNGADPNGSMEILLRGTNTLSAGQGPLIIVDGVSGADLSTVDFQEVESMDVLKDGSAAAIYGTRGTNGVIIITTKRAKAGRTSVEYDGSVSTQTVLSRAVPMTAKEFEYAINNYKPSASYALYGADTDWFDEVTRTPFSHRHTLSVSGGSESFSHRTSFNVQQNQGLLKNNDHNRYLLKSNIHQEALDGWLTLDYNLTYGKRDYQGSRTGIFRQAFLHNPTEPVYDPTDELNGGYFTVSAMDYYNPVAMQNERESKAEVNDITVNGRATLNIKPVKGLKWDNFVSARNQNFGSTDYLTRFYPGNTGKKGEASIENSYYKDLQYESTLQYSNKFGQHSLQGILGYTYEKEQYFSSYINNYDFDTDFFKVNNIGGGKALLTGNADMDSERSQSKYIAFFGRVMYNYADKYMASVSLRRDGSSRFGQNNKWGWFPAISLGWRLTQEDFLEDVEWLDELKLRAGYGVTGNQDFSNYKSLFLVKTSGNFYYDGKWSTAYAPASNANPDLAWEKKSEFNVGVDFEMLEGRLSGTIDYYYRLTSNLLYNYTVPVPPYDYGTFFTNVGKISNSGIELTLSGTPVKTKEVTWVSTLTAAHNSNKLISFTNDEFAGQEYRIGWLNTPLGVYCQRLIEGESIGTFYGPEFDSIRSSGSIKVKQTKESDWVNLGSAYPAVTLGWSNSVSFGNFSVSSTMRASIGGKVFNQMRAVYEGISDFGQKNILATWLDNTDYTGNPIYCSRYLEDASYFKWDNLSVTYNIPVKEGSLVKKLAVFATGQNLLVLTGYKGVDPEVSLTGLTPGIENLSYYPRARVFTAGVSLKF